MNTQDELTSIRQRAARVWLCTCLLPECRTEQDRARLLGALDAVLAIAERHGVKQWTEEIFAAVNDALEAGK